MRRQVCSFLGFLLLMLGGAVSVHAVDFNVEQACNSVVVVRTQQSVGSGFAISEHLILTNAHVVDAFRQFVIETYDGSRYTGELILSDSVTDLSVIEVKDVALTPLQPHMPPPMGSDVYAIGAPSGLSYTVSKGVLSTVDRQVRGVTYLQTDASISPGNSGGPLLDQYGGVIGVNTLSVEDVQNVALAIPIQTALSFLEQNGITVPAAGESAAEDTAQGSAAAVQPEAAVTPADTGTAAPAGQTETQAAQRTYQQTLQLMRRQNTILFLAVLALGLICLILMTALVSAKRKGYAWRRVAVAQREYVKRQYAQQQEAQKREEQQSVVTQGDTTIDDNSIKDNNTESNISDIKGDD